MFFYFLKYNNYILALEQIAPLQAVRTFAYLNLDRAAKAKVHVLPGKLCLFLKKKNKNYFLFSIH